MPYVGALFKSKAPHTTPWLAIEYEVGHEPTQLLADLAAAGWTGEKFLQPLTPLPKLPAGETDWSKAIQVSEVSVGKPGTGLFGGWSPAERKPFLAEVKRVLAKHGFRGVPHQKLTLADLM